MARKKTIKKTNESAEKTNEKTRFSSENQPEKRGNGRPKNVFGPLAKADNLSNDDVNKIFKNLLKCNPNELNKVVEKYPTVLTVTFANMITQDMKGKLTGKMEPTGRMVPSGKTGKDGKMIMEPEMRPERERSHDTVKYMLDRCLGKPIQTDLVINAGISEETERVIMGIFSKTKDISESINPTIIEPQIEYIEDDNE